jgi:uncharacterized protein DUF4352
MLTNGVRDAAATTKATDQFSTPPRPVTDTSIDGFKLAGAADAGQIAAQFRLVNTGSATYSIAPDNDSVALDAKVQQYQTDIVESISAGPLFADQLNVQPGGTALGWIVFDVPPATTITAAQFTLDSSFGNTGQWAVR